MSGKIFIALLVVAVAVAITIGMITLGPRPTGPARLGLGEVLQSREPRETSPDIAEAKLQEFVNGNTAFALGLYRLLREREGNLFCSPYSISLALAMAYAGAREETERQMAAVLHFTLPQEQLHPVINALDLKITGHTETAGIRLNIVNTPWGQTDYPFLPQYLDLLAKNYGAGIRLVDFQQAPEACRLHINAWVSEQTEGKIKNLLPQGLITSLTHLVLTNAIYFKGTWKYEFEEAEKGPFRLLDGAQVTVPLMEQEARFGYAVGEGYQAVELPYVGEGLSMVILLPALDRFEEFERTLTAGQLGAILEGIKGELVHLTMPKFSFESGFSLKDTLSELGMPDAFSREQADFSGMDGRGEIFIKDVVHKVFILVNEQGTEAAAATAVTMEKSIVTRPIEVRVDHPFIFIIRDRETGAILFLGRVVNPAA